MREERVEFEEGGRGDLAMAVDSIGGGELCRVFLGYY